MRTTLHSDIRPSLSGDHEDGGDLLAVRGAQWFASLLQRVPGLQIDEHLCQEDWGVVCFVRRNQKKFWIGLNAWDSEGAWLAHFHHGSFAWLQWISEVGHALVHDLRMEVRLESFHRHAQSA